MLKNTVLEAKSVWKRYKAASGACPWVLQGANLEIMEGDFISILGGSSSGKSCLLKVLSFHETAEQGAIYFEGRLVGRSGARELEQMSSERVWYVDGSISGNQIKIEARDRLAAVLLDEPSALLDPDPNNELLQQIYALNSSGVAVVIATQEPAVASRAPVIYKLSHGKLEKLTGISTRTQNRETL